MASRAAEVATFGERVETLFVEQLAEWPRLRDGVRGLAEAITRPVETGAGRFLLRHIPHRAASTTAPVDPDSIRRRPCFLCAENLDPEERGLPFGDLTIYANPFPIVDRHLTIVHREHRPQRIAGQVGALLDLTAALPESFVFYNGPECGASAPDHLHFQAGRRAGLPVVEESDATSRGAITLRDADRDRLADRVERLVARLAERTGRAPEPWVNVAALHEPSRGFTAFVLPRAKHRPEAFHSGRLTVSPATIDLCGVFVVPMAGDFEKITAGDVEAIVREVTLPRELLAELGDER